MIETIGNFLEPISSVVLGLATVVLVASVLATIGMAVYRKIEPEQHAYLSLRKLDDFVGMAVFGLIVVAAVVLAMYFFYAIGINIISELY